MPVFISIVIPIYNEEKQLFNNLNFVYSKLKKVNKKFEIIIINDGSKDNSLKIIKKFIKIDKKNIKLINIKKNIGVCRAISKGFKMARGKFITHCSIDLPYRFENIQKIFNLLHKYEFIIIQRKFRNENAWKNFTSIIWNLLCRLILGIKFTDLNYMQIFKKKNYEKLKINTFSPAGFTTEIIFKSFLMGIKIKTINTKWHKREVNNSKYGKLKDYISSFCHLLKIKLYSHGMSNYKNK